MYVCMDVYHVNSSTTYHLIRPFSVTVGVVLRLVFSNIAFVQFRI